MPVLPILLVLIGAIGGAVAAEMLSSGDADPAEAKGEAGKMEMATDETAKDAEKTMKAAEAEEEVPRSVVSFDRRVIVPIIIERRTQAIVLLELAVEVPSAITAEVEAAEPKLRDAFLSAMLSLAAGGAFDQGLADPVLIEQIRAILTDRARAILPDGSARVLILETLMRRA